MKKTLLYIVILAALAGGVWFAVFKDRGNPFGNSEAGFTITDTANVGKIFLSRTDGRSITVERKNGGWVVNGKYPVLKSTLYALLATLHKQQADAPVPRAKRDAVIAHMAGNSVKTEVYDLDGKLISTFFVGDEADNFSGTYMLMQGAKDPYVINVPGFNGYLTPRYPVDLKDWRDRHVFDLEADEIKSVSVAYKDIPVNSFTISQDNGKINVTVDTVYRNGHPLNEARAKAYLGFFSGVFCEGFMNGVPHLDSLIGISPVRCIVTVQPKQGPAQQLTVHWRPADRRSKNLNAPFPGTPEGYDSDRFFATMNGDTLTIQRVTFDKIFRNGYEFYEDNTANPAPADQPHSFIIHSGNK